MVKKFLEYSHPGIKMIGNLWIIILYKTGIKLENTNHYKSLKPCKNMTATIISV